MRSNISAVEDKATGPQRLLLPSCTYNASATWAAAIGSGLPGTYALCLIADMTNTLGDVVVKSGQNVAVFGMPPSAAGPVLVRARFVVAGTLTLKHVSTHLNTVVHRTHGQDNVGATLLAQGNATVNIEGCEFTSGNARGGGAILVEGFAMVSIVDCRLDGHHAWAGAAVYARDSSTVSLSGSSFAGNDAFGGAAVWAWDTSSLTVTNCTFDSNAASAVGFGGSCGGAIHADDTVQLRISASKFTNSTSGGEDLAILWVAHANYTDATANSKQPIG
jgi:hypothetical protein